MNTMTRFIIAFTCIFLSLLPAAARDTARCLSVVQVMEIVKKYHPVARQAGILVEKAKADVTIARAGFDPLFYNSFAQKTFDGTRYYEYNRPELSLPTWFGIEVTAGLEYLSGSRTDPQETSGKTSYIGLKVPLAQNLLMDKRRAALQTARIFRNASVAEQRSMLNDLLLEAAKAYWYWLQYYQVYQVLNNAVQVNEKRADLVKTAFRLGDRPAIDTAEAMAQLQNFQVLRENAWLEFQNAGLHLSAFLWSDNDQPVNLPPDAIPADQQALNEVENMALPQLDELLTAAAKNHPELLQYQFKLDALAVEKKLKFQELLPVVNFQYNQLGRGYNVLKTAGAPLFENNFRYGFSVGFPLRFSEGRGGYRKAKLKITETRLGQNQKQLEISNTVKSYYNELVALKKQLVLQERAYRNYLLLQRGEEIRFGAGESSLFLVNARETKTLEALQKLQELRVKYLVTISGLQWAAGVLA